MVGPAAAAFPPSVQRGEAPSPDQYGLLPGSRRRMRRGREPGLDEDDERGDGTVGVSIALKKERRGGGSGIVSSSLRNSYGSVVMCDLQRQPFPGEKHLSQQDNKHWSPRKDHMTSEVTKSVDSVDNYTKPEVLSDEKAV